MNGERFVFDTNIIIAILAGKTPAVTSARSDPEVLVSVITEIELLSFGRLSEHEEAEIRDFLSSCDVFYINPMIKDTAVNLRKKYSLKTPDAIIAATALFEKAQLVSDDNVLLRCRKLPVISSNTFFNRIG